MINVLKNKLATLNMAVSPQRVFSGARTVALLGTIAVAVAVAVVLGLWQGGEYRPLYGEQEQYDRNQVIAALEQNRFDYYVEPQKGNIMVERSQVAAARIAMAAAGIEAKVPAGLEILNKDFALGTSQFIENARYRHGLEGELARSIMTLDGVSNARVHLALPKQTLFVGRNKELPSASVVVVLTPGRVLHSDNIAAIVNLVAGSVPDLQADRVNVIDQHGNLLSNQIGQGTGIGELGNSQYLSYTQKLEAEYIESAAKMLRPMVGVNNFQVEVAASVNFDRVEATEESYGPKGTVRNEFSSFDNEGQKEPEGVPGTQSNRLPEGKEDGDGTLVNKRGESSKDYAVDRTLKHIKYQQGSVERLTVSVLLNGEAESFSDAQRENIRTMLIDALGLDEARGDKLSLFVHPFNTDAPELLASTPSWWMDNIWLDYLRYILSAVVSLVILLVVIRPAVRALAQQNASRETVNAGANEGTLSRTVAGEFVGGSTDMAVGSEGSKTPAMNDMPDLPTPETGLEGQSSYLQMLSEREPERVAHVVKQWMTPKNADI
ncbi:flagellar M-ring protein FliF [Grimontia hollisae]|uniref:Flagellar M-ring protein n=2 Tax=Grimontia hollisae TaxID=673 RepID=D0I451_GRIHO|nr:flagellar basal-body MS-ring/collar protein FliF [Grimontia hollisae]AMG30496.1 flagellar M-ring protein FliF [Grimontia hollisae]EEY73829.1 flagellar M-ring protein FliF [Grimontia hollisae CIP 101886]MDF2183777.1 flagellar basal-body MS-ring/collar protein FliF [Grimontia hollisae]STO41905.1 Flagellar M-ring protein [Grimontia hollisae]STO55829.1 Flagellar M-ring protein [Grimontia hollisae]